MDKLDDVDYKLGHVHDPVPGCRRKCIFREREREFQQERDYGACETCNTSMKRAILL